MSIGINQKNTASDSHPWIRVPLRKPGSPVEKLQHTTGEKKSEIGHTEEARQ